MALESLNELGDNVIFCSLIVSSGIESFYKSALYRYMYAKFKKERKHSHKSSHTLQNRYLTVTVFLWLTVLQHNWSLTSNIPITWQVFDTAYHAMPEYMGEYNEPVKVFLSEFIAFFSPNFMVGLHYLVK